MRESTFLKFYSPEKTNNFTKDLTMDKISHQLIFLELEYPSYDVRSILSCLTLEQLLQNLWPLRVTGHGDKQVWLASKLSHNCHAILMFPIEPPLASNVSSSQYFPSKYRILMIITEDLICPWSCITYSFLCSLSHTFVGISS